MLNAERVGMNIIFFMQDTGAVYGAERATLDLAHGLRECGESVRFFLIDESRRGKPGAFSGVLKSEGFAVQSFPVRGRLSLRLAMQLRQAFSSAGGQILHANGYKANVHARLSGIRPVVTTVHGWLFRRDWKEQLFHAVELRCLRRCDRVICLSHFYQDLLLRSAVPAERLNLIPSGLRNLPHEHAHRPSSPGRPVTIGMLGRFSEEKNHALFLEAAALVHAKRPDIRFHIAGSGPLEEAIRSTCASRGLTDVLRLSPYLDVSDYFNGVDIYVICSRIENLPYSVLEAMARQRPVIGTRVGGIPDMIGDGQTGYLVETDQPRSLAEAMIRLADDPAHAALMGARGWRKLMDEFSFSQSVNRHRELYRDVLRIR